MAVKTTATNASVGAFTKAINDAEKRADVKANMAMMRAATGKRAKTWGTSIIGFGSYDYRYASGREGTWPVTGVSPRAQNISVYVMPGFEKYGALLKKLGKHKLGKSCLYIKRLSDVDQGVLTTLIERSVADMNKKYNSG